LKNAYIISTGTELVRGSTADTNSIFLSRRLIELGINVTGKSVVGDDARVIRNTFENALTAADIVIASGGLGPTHDDLTKKIACEVMRVKTEIVTVELDRIKEFFASRRRPMPESNIKQAMFPPEAVILKNERGTAPGMYLKQDSKLLILLPGPPHEMGNMYLQEVEPRLIDEYQLCGTGDVSRIIKVFGPGESQLEEMLKDVMENQQGYSAALTVKQGEIHIGISIDSIDSKGVVNRQEMLEEITDRIKKLIGNNIIGFDEDTLVKKTAALLQKRGKKIALAESCTGGLLSKMITDLPGSSDYFWGSVISYSNEAKRVFLGVKDATLNKFGAVSRETAEEMAGGIVARSGVDIGVAVTGIAGPSGGSDEKPVGLVYIAVMYNGSCTVRELRFGGKRDVIRIISAKTALDMVRRKLAAEEA